MNDEFLHRLRVRPSRSFARRLKASLDRRRPRSFALLRPGFFRGFGIALLAGAVASGIAAVATFGVPGAVLDLFRGPAQAPPSLSAGATRESDDAVRGEASAPFDERAARKAAGARAPLAVKPGTTAVRDAGDGDDTRDAGGADAVRTDDRGAVAPDAEGHDATARRRENGE